MRIMTVRQPWAWAIIHGGKDVENRVRNIAGGYRGPVAIHAGAARFEDDGQYREVKRAIVSEQNGWPADDAELWSADLVEPDDPRFVYSAIIGVVDLIDVHGPHPENRCGGVATGWSEPDAWHLIMQKPRALDEPIPYKGALGLRNLAVNDPHTTARILAQIGTP